MGFYRFVISYLKTHSIPVFKSFFKAYKDTTANSRAQEDTGKKHPIDDFFKSMLSKTNLAAPPIDATTSLRILNIEPEGDKEVDPKFILERYYILYKKNDPAIGGTVYLQSKVFAAKECLMNNYPNATEIEQEFYTEVVEPEEKAAEEERREKQAQKQEQNAKKESKKESKEQKK